MSSFSELLNLPNLIVGHPIAVRPDAPKKEQGFSQEDAEKMALSVARKRELARTLREIDRTGERIRPGPPAGGNVPGYDEQVMNKAAQDKWRQVVALSRQRATEDHNAKYGIKEDPFNGPGPNFGSAPVKFSTY